jgi:hypothetical protein
MPPDYLLKYPTSDTGAENYAVYGSGIVRRVGAQELTHLRDTLKVPQIEAPDKTQRDRLAQVDAALRGQD